jgi:hypothetical protein
VLKGIGVGAGLALGFARGGGRRFCPVAAIPTINASAITAITDLIFTVLSLLNLSALNYMIENHYGCSLSRDIGPCAAPIQPCH